MRGPLCHGGAVVVTAMVRLSDRIGVRSPMDPCLDARRIYFGMELEAKSVGGCDEEGLC